MQLHYLLLATFLLSGCSTHETLATKTENQASLVSKEATPMLLDLERIPQDVSFYTQNIQEKRLVTQNFYKNYFRPWNIEKISTTLHDAMWPHRSFNAKNSYGENLQPLSEEFFQNVLANSNYIEFATLNKQALSLDLLNMRAFPTETPLFKDPKKAGEGFPFDYLQNSALFANEPLFVSHYSADKQWVFVKSNFAFGWVKSKNIAFLDKDQSDSWQKKEQVFIIKEGIPIYSENGDFLFHSRVGMLFALLEEDENSYTVMTFGRDMDAKALPQKSKISKTVAHKGPLSFNANNINAIMGAISKSKYGWGGMYGQKDCSSTLRDFYTPFGLWLPRNSSQQANKGLKISLKNLNEEQKIKTIQEHAIPFETLLYRRGHIVMYVGSYKDEIIVFQNVWGVRTKEKEEEEEGRFVVGKSIFSTLTLGKELENFDKESSFIKATESLNLLTK